MTDGTIWISAVWSLIFVNLLKTQNSLRLLSRVLLTLSRLKSVIISSKWRQNVIFLIPCILWEVAFFVGLFSNSSGDHVMENIHRKIMGHCRKRAFRVVSVFVVWRRDKGFYGRQPSGNLCGLQEPISRILRNFK